MSKDKKVNMTQKALEEALASHSIFRVEVPKVGDTVNIRGVKIKIVDQDTLDKEAMDDNLTFVCMPCVMNGKKTLCVPGSIKAICGKCRQDVWLSPATRQSHPGEAPIRCIECVMKERKEES